MRIVLLTCTLFLAITIGFAQDVPETTEPFMEPKDTVSVVKRQSPKKAALLSAALPGAGQVYNKKYWKLPIIYGGLAGLGTWVGINAKNLRGYTNAYKLEIDDDPNTTGSYKGITGANPLNVKRNDAKRSLDLSIILLSVFYSLNIVDAAVDAHLFDYSITEDLSVSIEPDVFELQAYQYRQQAIGLNIGLHFK